MKTLSFRFQRILFSWVQISVLLLCLFFATPSPLAQAHMAQRALSGNMFYLQTGRDSQLPDYYEMSPANPSSSIIRPRAYWISPVQTATFAQGTWTLSVSVNVTVLPSINIYTLSVLSSTGVWVRDIGAGAVSRRYNVAGTQHDTITFFSTTVRLQNERLEIYYITPNWCTAAPIITGAHTTYISTPLTM